MASHFLLPYMFFILPLSLRIFLFFSCSVFMVLPTASLRSLASQQITLEDDEDDDSDSDAGSAISDDDDGGFGGPSADAAATGGMAAASTNRRMSLTMLQGVTAHDDRHWLVKLVTPKQGAVGTGKKKLAKKTGVITLIMVIPYVCWGCLVIAFYVMFHQKLKGMDDPLAQVRFMQHRLLNS